MQCRAIATEMTDEQCREVASLLYTLMEHLEAIPQERRAAKITGKVVGLVKSCDSMSDNIEYLDETIRKINRDQSAQNRDDKRSIRKIIDKIRVSVGLVNQDIGDTFKSLQDKTQRFGNEHDPHVVIFNKLELEIMLFALCQMEVEYGEPA